MVWGCISWYGKGELEGIETTLDSERYCEVLEGTLLPFAAETFGERWTLQHDGASVHRSKHTVGFLETKGVDVLPWPAKSPDLNIIENVWGMLARAVYKDGRQFKDREELGHVIVDCWEALGEDYIRNLYKSIPSRLLAVIEKCGGPTKY